MSLNTLSDRGQTASKSVLRIDFEAYFEAIKNLYHKTENPEGAFPLNVAENKLSWSILKAQMESLASRYPIPDWVAGYTDSTGAPSFRSTVAKFYERFISNCKINPDNLGMSAGASSVIELSSWILCEPGDVAVIPAPCYPVYKQDLQYKSGVERYNLLTHRELSDLKGGPLLTTSHLDKALAEIKSQGKRFRILIITNPDNPTGGMYDQAKLNELADWCVVQNIHMIVNEIYCLSLINTKHPDLQDDYSQHVQFYSFINVIQSRNSEYLHHWYALSKDFGASGFRVGAVYSLNQQFIQAYNNLNAPSMVSNYAQWIFELILEDQGFIEKYIDNNQKVLTESYLTAVRQLRKSKIPYAPAHGSLFVWLDLSEFMQGDTQEAESKFWLELYKETGILLTPGEGFGHSKRGQFRLVYSCVSKEDLEVAMIRLSKFVENKRR